MTVQTVSHNTDGSTSVNTGGGTTSSVDAPQGAGYQVRSGMHGRTTNDLSQVADTDLINIQGMEITFAMAKDMGLINPHKPDTGLSIGNAVPEAAPTAPKGIETGHEGYDRTCAELNAQVSEGNLGFEEASQYQTALGQVALAGLTVSEASDTLDGIADGSIDPNMLPADQRQVVENLQSTVSDAATKSVMSEIGQGGFNRLAEIAKGDADFNDVLKNYASMRALGRADHTWAEFLVEAESWSKGQR